MKFDHDLHIHSVLSTCCAHPFMTPDRILEYALEYYGEKTAVPMFRKHVAWYSTGMKDATHFRMKINQILDSDVLKVAIREFWSII